MSQEKGILTVHFSRRWAASVLFSGLLLMLLIFLVMLLSGKVLWQQFFLDFFIVVSGLMYWKGKYFEVYANKIKVYALFQFVSRTYEIDSPENLMITKRFVLIENRGQRKKLRIGKLMARADDWQKFEHYVRQSDPGKELHD